MLLIATITAIIAAFVAVAAFAGWIRTQRQLKAQRLSHEALITSLRDEIRRVNRGAMGMGKHLIAIEQQLNEFEQPEKNHPPVLSETTTNYNQVLELLEQGCTPEQITKACGMSKAEIELMALVRQTPAVTP